MKDRPAIVVEEAHLSRELGEFDITMIGVGAMIGAGIFVLTGIAAGTAGPGLLLSFALNGIVTIFTAMVYAELGSAIPEAGGGYLWVRRGLSASQGFLAGWMSWFSHAVAGALYALGFGSYFALLLREVGVPLPGFTEGLLHRGLAVVVLGVFVYINYRGTSETGLAGNIVTLGKLAVIGLFIGFGLWATARQPHLATHYEPFLPNGWGSVFAAMGFTFIAFEGYEIIVQAGEEVKNPRRTIPRAVFWSLIIVVPIYILVAFTALGALQTSQPSWQFLGQHKELGLVEAARQFMPLGTLLLLFGGLLSTVSALNATTFSSTRVAYAMGRDRALPTSFAQIHPTNRTPYRALLATAGIMLAMVLFIPLEDVATAADVMFLLLFIQVNYAVIRIRNEFGDRLRYGYLMPFYPAVPILGIVLQAFLAIYLYRFSPKAWLLAAAWIGVGVVLFFVYARKRFEKTERPRIALEEHKAVRRERKEKRVLVGVSTVKESETELRIAAALARGQQADLLAVNVVQVPSQTPPRAVAGRTAESEELLDDLSALAEREGLTLHATVAVGHSVSRVLRTVADAQQVTTLVLGWRGQIYERRIRGSVADAALHQSPLDVLVVRDKGLPRKVKRVTLAVSPFKETTLVVATACALARGFEAHLRVVSFRKKAENEEEAAKFKAWFEEIKEKCVGAAGGAKKMEAEVEESANALNALVAEGEEADVIVVGASRDWVDKEHLLGSFADAVANRSKATVVVAKEEQAKIITLVRRGLDVFRRK